MFHNAHVKLYHHHIHIFYVRSNVVQTVPTPTGSTEVRLCYVTAQSVVQLLFQVQRRNLSPQAFQRPWKTSAVFVSMSEFAKTRERQLIEMRHENGLSILYVRVLEISAQLGEVVAVAGVHPPDGLLHCIWGLVQGLSPHLPQKPTWYLVLDNELAAGGCEKSSWSFSWAWTGGDSKSRSSSFCLYGQISKPEHGWICYLLHFLVGHPSVAYVCLRRAPVHVLSHGVGQQ